MTLLIVDDEILAVQGILDDVPWDELPYDKVLTANSYSQAVNLFMEQEIQVLLCDIEMPFGSGMDLVRWVKEHHPDTECIFLTCHDSFKFAQEAVRLQCLGYILKPADTEELMEYLQKAGEKIEQKSTADRYSSYGKMYLNQLSSDGSGEEQEDVMERVEQYIREHISEELSQEELARMVYISPTHLRRLFKKKYHTTMVDYITDMRISLAEELLRDSRLSISAVAEKTGFHNYSYFTKIFKKYKGKTPREFRQDLEK